MTARDPDESAVVTAEREEQRTLRDAEDGCYWKSVGGVIYDDRDLPDRSEW